MPVSFLLYISLFGRRSIKIGDRVWLNIEQVLHHNFFEELCWLRCMALDIVDQKDPIDCKLRPEEGPLHFLSFIFCSIFFYFLRFGCD